MANAGDKMNEGNMLELLDVDEYAIAKSFFRDFKINQPILYSILENRSAGKVFTDDKSHPSFMLVHSPAAYVFLGGNPDQTSLRKIVSYLKILSNASLVSPLDWKFRTFFEGASFCCVERLQLQRHSDFSNLDSWKDNLAARYSIHRIDRETFPQCNWRSFVLSCYGDADHFLANGMGFCLVDQGKIISESYAFIAAGKAEIGVVTDENYRGLNLGTSICAVMLDYCYKNNIEPFWSCNIDNLASVAIAKKLGFEEDCKYFFLKWTTP
jgi:RimJ/RimL family protein N-acetyltransferase